MRSVHLHRILLFVLLCAVASAQDVPLRFHGRGGTEGALWPVTFGVPFREGALPDGRRVELVGPEGRSFPVQVRTTARWLDGSTQWVLVDAQLPLPGEEPADYSLRWGANAQRPPAPEARAAWQQGRDALVVNTGPLQAAISTADMRLLRQVRVRGDDGQWANLFEGGASSDILLEDGEGTLYAGRWAEAPSVEVEEEGSLRVVVKVEGWHTSEQGENLGRRIVRFYFHAGRRDVRVFDIFVKTADSELVQYRNIALALPFVGDAYQFRGIGMERPARTNQRASLFQYRHDQFEAVADGRRVAAGRRAPGSATVSEGQTAFTVTRRFFHQMFPAEIEVQPGQLFLHFWPRHGKEPAHLGDNMTEDNLGHLWWVHEGRNLDFRVPEEAYRYRHVTPSKFEGMAAANAMGMARTIEYWVDFHGEGDPAPGAENFRANPLMVVDPQWLADSQTFWNISPRSEHYAELEDTLERTLQFLPAMYERVGDFGLWNFGAYHQNYKPTLDAARLHRIWKGFHHGGPRWPWLTFARTGGPEHFDFAEIHARHLMDVSITSWECDEYNERHRRGDEAWHANRAFKFLGGKNRYKGIVHWDRGSWIAYNAQVDWALWHYYMTGYRRAWDVANDMGEYLLRRTFSTPRTRRGGMARGQTALEMYRATHDERYRDFAIRQMHHPDRGFATVAKNDPERHGIGNIYYAPFIERYWETFREEELKPIIVNWARVRRGPEGGPGTGWHTRDTHYNMMALGYQLTGDPSFLRFGLAQARLFLENRLTGVDPDLEGVAVAGFAGVPGYTAQQWGHFVRALDDHYERTGERLLLPKTPDTWPMRTTFRSLRGQRDADRNRFHRLAFHVRKAPGQALEVEFPLQTRNRTQLTLVDPRGRTRQEWLEPENRRVEFTFRLPAHAVAGDYKVEFHCPEIRSDLTTQWPLPGRYEHLVVEMPVEVLRTGWYYIMPTAPRGGGEGTIRIRTSMRPLYYESHRFYDPDGEVAFEFSEQGHVVGNLQKELKVPPRQQGQLWIYITRQTGNSGDGTIMEGDVAPVVSFCRDAFFVPRSLTE